MLRLDRCVLAMRRSLIPILIIVLAYVAFPPLLRQLFHSELPVVTLKAYSTPRSLPDFAFSDASGRSLTLSHLNGSFILVNVWATWCPPCRQEMASLDRLALRLADKGIRIVPISIDVSGVPSVRYFYSDLGLKNLPIYVDPSKGVVDALGIIGIPTTLLIGPDGREIARMAGPAKWDAPESVKRIMELAGP